MAKNILNNIVNHANKVIEDGLKARHERRELGKQAYQELNNFITSKKVQKLREKNQKILATSLGNSIKSKEELYIEALMTGNDLTGSLLYDWDKKDGNPQHSGGYKHACIKNAICYKETVSKHEISLFSKNKYSISETILLAQPQRVIDMGGGDGLKTVQILNLLPSESVAGITITSKDISPYLLDEYTKNIEQQNKVNNLNIKVSTRYENFLDCHELLSNKDKRLFLFSGGTIGQFDDDTVIEILKNMFSDQLRGKRHSITTVFIAPNKNSDMYEEHINKLLAAYGSPNTTNPFYDKSSHKLIEDWVMSGIEHWLGKQVKGKLTFHVEYRDDEEKGGAIVLGAKVKQSFTIKIGSATYTKNEGDIIYAIQSRRFTKSHFNMLAQAAGHTIDSFFDEEGVGIALMHTGSFNKKNITPSRITSWKQKAKLFGAGMLLISGMYMGGKRNEFNNERNREKNKKITVEQKLANKRFKGLVYDSKQDSTDVKFEYFQQLLDDYYENLYNRYELNRLSNSDTETIKKLLTQWLLNEDETIVDIMMNHYVGQNTIDVKNEKISELVESFLEKNDYLLGDENIKLTLHESLTPYEEACKNTLDEKNEKIGVNQFSYNIKGTYVAGTERSGYTWLGVYTTRKNERFVYGIYNNKGKDVVVGIPVSQCKGTEFDKTLKSVTAPGSILPANVSNEYGTLSVEYGKKIAQDYFQKPYAYTLAQKIAKCLEIESPKIVVKRKDILTRITYLIKEGYDFSGIASSSSKDVMILFAHTYCCDLYDDNKDTINQTNTINSIFTVYIKQYAPSNKEAFDTYQKMADIKGKIFLRLCENPITKDINTQEALLWITKNQDVFKDYLINDYGNAGLLWKIDNNSISQYSKSNLDDILIEPSMRGTIYEYTDSKGDVYEAKIHEGKLYARRKLQKEDISIEKATDDIINLCKKQGYGSWRKEVEVDYQEAKRKGMVGTIRAIESSRSGFRDYILGKLYTFNTDFGNYIIQDRAIFNDQLGKSVSESIGPVGM